MEQETAAAHAEARALRGRIAAALGAGPADRLVLAPGILVGLEVLLGARGARTLLLTDREYYDARHFPRRTVTVAPFSSAEAVADAVAAARPDVVIASAVGWRGDVLPAPALFAALRRAPGPRPLLVLDGTHLGALGFPAPGGFGADVVCGDPGKWTAPREHENRLAYFWFAEAALLAELAPFLAPLFLAHPRPAPRSAALLQARWVSPTDVRALDRILRAPALRPAGLRRRHARDLALRAALARRFGLPAPPVPSAILWLPEAVARRRAREITALERHLPVWRVAGQGARLLCRAEFLPAALARRLLRG